MVKASQINTTNVTSEQIGRCYKVFGPDNKAFYQVESESDPLTEYKVTWDREYGFRCTCDAGQDGFAHCKLGVCKHVVWSVAASREEREAIRAINAAIAAQAEKKAEVKPLAPMTASEKRDNHNLNGGRIYGLSLIAEMQQLAGEVFTH